MTTVTRKIFLALVVSFSFLSCFASNLLGWYAAPYTVADSGNYLDVNGVLAPVTLTTSGIYPVNDYVYVDDACGTSPKKPAGGGPNIGPGGIRYDLACGHFVLVNSYSVDIDATPPNVPAVSDQGVSTSNTTVTFTWPAVTDPWGPGIGSYYLQIATDAGFSNIVFDSNVGNVTSYAWPSGVMGNTYYARAYAIDAMGNASGWSATTDGIAIAPATPPNTPTGGNAVATGGAPNSGLGDVALSWVDNGGYPTGFKIYRSIGNAVPTLLYSTVGVVTSTSDINLADNTTYNYRIYAFNAAGDSVGFTAMSAHTPNRTAPSNIASILVGPTPARVGVVRVTVNFSVAMNMAVPPSVNFDTAPAPVSYYPFTGAFTSATQWVGSFSIPSGQSAVFDGFATLRVFGGVDSLGTMMGASNNAKTFLILTAVITNNQPYFSQLAFDNVPAFNGNIVSAKPVITARYVNMNNALPSFLVPSLRVSVDGAVRFITPNSVVQVGANIYDLNFVVTTPLSNATHFIEVGLQDGFYFQATPITRSVMVTSTQMGVAGTVANLPNPFSPNGDGVNDTTQIAYNLTQSADTSLFIYSIDGVMVYRSDMVAGQNGARAGFNSVSWSGNSGFMLAGANVSLPNGVYICHIVSRVNGATTSLGRIKIVILK
jgi:hypothetical protein